MSLIDRPEPLRRPRQPPTGPKPVLPMVQLPIFRVKARHLEDYLYEVYRMGEFDFLLAAGLKAGECPEYIVQAKLNCFWLLIHCASCARALALLSTGSSIAANMAMIAITTNNSIKVKAGAPSCPGAARRRLANVLTLQQPRSLARWSRPIRSTRFSQKSGW